MKNTVTFQSGHLTLAGHLNTPEGCSGGTKAPAIVTVTPMSGIKEQTSGLYAGKMCERGFVTLAFDHGSFGASEGQPRCDENAFAKVEDIKNAVTYLSTLPMVDPDRIGVIGICAGGGYASYAAATERRIKAVATVSAVTSLRNFFKDDMGLGSQGVIAMLEEAGRARQSQAAGSEPVFVPVLPDELPIGAPDFLVEATDYYRTPRAGHSNWRNETLLTSYEQALSHSALDVIDMVAPHPMLFIAGTRANTAHFSDEAFEAAGDPKELHWIEGASHIDLYDKDEYVQPAVETMDAFFKAHL
jgi:fermentation-respiration switch protein FrsA (DUF1100 family)